MNIFSENKLLSLVKRELKKGGAGLTSSQIDAVENIEGMKSKGSEIDNTTLLTVGDRVDNKLDIDFNLLTSSGASGSTYFNNYPIPLASKLKQINIKADIGTTVNLYVYTIEDSGGGIYVFTKLYEYASFITTSSVHTEYITDTYEIPQGAFIGIKQDSNFYYRVATNASFKLGSASIQSTEMAFDYSIQSGSAEFKDKFDSLDNDIRIVSSNISTVSDDTNVKLHKTSLFETTFNNLDDFTVVNWNATSNKAIPTALGIDNYLWLDKRYHVDNISYDFQVKLYNDTVAVFQFYTSIGTGYGKMRIDIPNSKLEITAYSGDGVISSKILNFTITNGEIYRVQLKRTDG